MATHVEPSYLTPAQVARRYALRAGKPMAPSTIIRWALRGLVGPDGTRIKLRSQRVGRAMVFTEFDLNEFFAQLAGTAEAQAAPARTPAERRRDSERAAQQLEQLGC